MTNYRYVPTRLDTASHLFDLARLHPSQHIIFPLMIPEINLDLKISPVLISCLAIRDVLPTPGVPSSATAHLRFLTTHDSSILLLLVWQCFA